MTAQVSTEYGPLFSEVRRENPQSDENSQDSKVPASREEALSYARKNIAKAREQAAEIRLRKAARDSQTKSSRTRTSDLESEEEKEHQQDESHTPKEKPFGEKKNIHTLSCFQNESSRPLKKLGGKNNIVGFGN